MGRITREAVMGQVEESEVPGGKQEEKADRRGHRIAQAPAPERRSVYGLVQARKEGHQDDSVHQECRRDPAAPGRQANAERRAQQQSCVRPKTQEPRGVRTARQPLELWQQSGGLAHAEIVSSCLLRVGSLGGTRPVSACSEASITYRSGVAIQTFRYCGSEGSGCSAM